MEMSGKNNLMEASNYSGKTAKEIMEASNQQFLRSVSSVVEENVCKTREKLRTMAVTTAQNFGLGVAVHIRGLQVWINCQEWSLVWPADFESANRQALNAVMDNFATSMDIMLKEEGFEIRSSTSFSFYHLGQ